MGKSAAEVLQANLQALKAAEHGPTAQLAFARKAGFGEGTVSRARRGESNTTLESLEALARAVRFEAWQLLVPGLDPTDPPRAVTGSDKRTVEVFDVKISIAALELARAWEHLPLEQRKEFKRKIIAASLAVPRADVVPDEKLHGLAAPDTPTYKRHAAATAAKGAAPRKRPKTSKHDQ